jgi:hypothetical protein
VSNRYRHVATGVFVPLFIGVVGFFDLTQRPAFANFRSVDVFQLIVCGMCFGIALTGLIEFLRGFRTS